MDFLYIDGGCSGNGQRDLSKRRMIAVVVHDRHVVHEAEYAGGSNNIAELIALRNALQWCLANNVMQAVIHTDSKNTCAWARPGSKVGLFVNDADRVRGLQEEIARLRAMIRYDLRWIPRQFNLAGHVIEAKYDL